MAVPKAVGRRHDPAAALGSTYVPRLRGSYSAPLATLALPLPHNLSLGLCEADFATVVGMQVQNQIGGTLRANRPACARCWTALPRAASRASGGLPIGSVKRSICAMAAGGCSARAARRWPSWKQRAKSALPPPRRRGGVLRKPLGAGATGDAGARGAGRRWAGSGIWSWCWSRATRSA